MAGFTAAAWKAIYGKDDFTSITLSELNDESQVSDYFGDLYRTTWRYWRRFRHLEEEELLILIAIPLAVLMFSATFLMTQGQESPLKKTKKPTVTRQQRENTPALDVRHVKAINLDEISKMINDQVRCLVVMLG